MLKQDPFVSYQEKKLKTCRILLRSKEKVPSACREAYRALREGEYVSVPGMAKSQDLPVIYLFPLAHFEKIQTFLSGEMNTETEENENVRRLRQRFWRLFLMSATFLDSCRRRIRLTEKDMAFLRRNCGEEELLSVRAYFLQDTGTVILWPGV